MDISALVPWIDRWGLEPDGEPLVTPYALSRLLPVRTEGRPAMPKLGASADERRGGSAMAWWYGQGAAPVLAHDDDAYAELDKYKRYWTTSNTGAALDRYQGACRCVMR